MKPKRTLIRSMCDLCVVAFVSTSSVQAATYYVDASGPSSGQTGQDWDHPWLTIQQALGYAFLTAGDEIHVAGGTYNPSSQSTAIGLFSQVSIQGGFVGYPNSASSNDRTEVSILSGDLQGNDNPGTPSTYDDNSYGVVLIPDGAQPPTNQSASDFADRANLDGFSITAGRHTAGLHTNLTVSTATAVIIRNCTIHDNTISANFGGGNGGGVYVADNASVVLRRCDIYQNHAFYDGGGIAAAGHVTVLNCSVHENTARFDGGGMKGLDTTDAVLIIVSSTIANNAAGTAASGYGGGIALLTNGGTLKLINSKITGNTTAGNSGGGIRVNANNILEITNCTISGNQATGTTGSGGGVCIASPNSNDFMTNSILWGNSANTNPQFQGGLTATYSDIQQTSGTYSGTGNINSDPLFTAGYRLQCGSLCINAGHNSPEVPDDTKRCQRRRPHRIERSTPANTRS